MYCTLWTLPPSPLAAIHIVMRAEKIFSTKYSTVYQLLGIIRSDTVVQWISAGIVWVRSWVQSYYMLDFFSVNTQKDVVGITRHVVTTISAFSFTMLLSDKILTHIVNHISNPSYHLQCLYCQGGYVFSAKPNLITCVVYIFLVDWSY